MMKIMKSIMLIATTLMLSTPAFSFETAAEELETAGPVLTEAFTESGKGYFDLVKSLSDSEIDDYITQFKEEGKEGEAYGLLSWKAIKDDLGDFVKYEDCTVYRTDGGAVIISIIAKFKKAETVMTLSMTSEMQDVYYVKFEKVKSSGLLPFGAIITVLLSAAIVMEIMHKRNNKNLTV